jgi:hypothetical protein
MSLPSYKVFNINSHDKRMIYAQLNQVDFKENPTVLTISSLSNFQGEAMDNIDSFFQDNPIEAFPYSVYVIGDCPYYTGDINVIKDKVNLPQFFNRTPQALNQKENIVLNKLLLKKDKFNHISAHDYQPVFNSYAIGQKLIAQLQNESEYLSKITKRLKEYNGKER